MSDNGSFLFPALVLGGALWLGVQDRKVSKYKKTCNMRATVAGYRDWDGGDGMIRPEVLEDLTLMMDDKLKDPKSWTQQSLANSVWRQIYGRKCSFKKYLGVATEKGEHMGEQFLSLAQQRILVAETQG